MAAVAIVYGFREGILKRLPDLSSLTLPGGISAEFKRELALVEASVNEKELAKLEQLELGSESGQAQSRSVVEEPSVTAPSPGPNKQTGAPVARR